ncbi:MAG: DMT family transporter [Brachymonas denitrificans]|uniref:DMT family transporter n=1 Tax=Brachymonas denitrificans TaxID=28220 RepID=UPI002AFFA6C6|nr:DMT family transporter [Brachymonas denitrificans]
MQALPRSLALLCLAASMLLVGSYVALTKPLALVFPVMLLAWLRFGIGGGAMLHWLRKPAGEPPMTPRTRWLLFLESFFGNFLFTLCMIAGMRLTTAVAASVIMASIPAVVAVLGWLILRERMTLRILLSILCAVGGVALLALARGNGAANASAQSSWLGYVLLFAAVVCEASYSIIGKLLTASLSPRRITALINLWGLALSTPLGLYAAWQFDFGAVPPSIWLLLLFYALAACMGSVWLWMTGLKVIPASQAGVFTVMLPVGTALTGVLALGETLNAMQGLALGIALLGVLMATLPGRTQALPPVSS